MSVKICFTLLATILWLSSCMPKFKDRGLPKPNQDHVYQLLTGLGSTSGRTWRPIAGPGHMGIGDETSQRPNLFRFPEEATNNLDAWNSGVLKNAYTFIESENSFIPKNTKTTVWGILAQRHFGISTREDALVSDPNLKKASFKLRNERNGIGIGYTLEITDGSYMGRFDSCYKYQILFISNDTLRLRHLYKSSSGHDQAPKTYAWYSTYVSNQNQDPPLSLDLVFSLLTDGNDINGKTWRPTSFGLGKSTKEAMKSEFFNFNNGISYDAWIQGIFQNRYTFVGIGCRFIPKNNKTTVLGTYSAKQMGIESDGAEYIATIDTNLKETTFKLVNEKNGIGTGYTLEITEGGYMGHFDSRQKYQIMAISKDMLQLRHLYSNNPDTDPSIDAYAWYSTYVTNEEPEAPSIDNDPIHKLLTGNNNTQGKTWKHVSSNNVIGTGPASSLLPEQWLYWDYYVTPLTNGLFNNSFTFVGTTTKFIPKNQNTTVQYAYGNKYFGMNLQKNEFAAIVDPKLKATNFILQYENNAIGTGYTLKIMDNSYMGIYDLRNKYQIISITEEKLILRHLSSDDPYTNPNDDNIAWYNTYVSE